MEGDTHAVLGLSFLKCIGDLISEQQNSPLWHLSNLHIFVDKINDIFRILHRKLKKFQKNMRIFLSEFTQIKQMS